MDRLPMPELQEKEPRTIVEVLAPNGLRFGHGTVSAEAQLESGELTPEAFQAGLDIITSDPEVFVPVDEDAHDDGCGDGRPAELIYRVVNGVKEVFNKSRRRAKLFGGGLVVAASMWRSVNGAPQHGETVNGDRAYIAGELKKRGISFGAHTDNHAQGEACGCGAIDKYGEVTKNVVTYKDEILSTLPALYGNTFEDNADAIHAVIDRYQALADTEAYMEGGSGKQTMKLLEDEGAVIKELADRHLEDYIIINDVEGTTFDQRKLDDKLKQRGIQSTAQAFVVDTWRGRMYADAVADIARSVAETNGTVAAFDIERVRKEAYADFLIRTLAVSGTLTQNDQPIIGRRVANKAHYALAA